MGAVVSALAFPHPPRDLSASELKSRGSQLVSLITASKIRIPAIHIERPRSRYTIVYSHGNAEDVGISLYYLDCLSHATDCSVFSYEYPGYSISEGKPSEKGTYEAINAAYDHLTTQRGLTPDRIILFGRSLGTGPTVDLCSRTHGLAGCILQSPLESGIRCFLGVCSSYALYPLDIYRSYDKISNVSCPVFIMHGEADGVVPCRNGKALHAKLRERPFHDKVAYDPVWFPNVGHNDMPEGECLDECRKFVMFLEGRRRDE